MINIKSPTLNHEIVCIVSNNVDLELVSTVSNYLNSKSVYYPMFKMPSVSHKKNQFHKPNDDGYISNIIAQKAATQILNAIAKLKNSNILFIGLDKIQLTYFQLEKYKKLKIFYINKLSEVESIFSIIKYYEKDILYCNPADIPEGLFIAKTQNKIIKIDVNADRINPLIENGGNGIVVSEKNNDLSDIIITNYALAIEADIKFIDYTSEKDIDDFYKNLLKWKREESYGSFIKISAYINKVLEGINLEKYQFVTFFTNGIPYGILLNDIIVCTYVLRSVAEDMFIFNNIYYETTHTNFNSALIFSPEPSSLGCSVIEETNIVETLMKKNNFNVKSLRNKQATVRAFDQTVSNFPYDILHIASHGGEITGYYIEKEFIDRKRVKHKIEYEEIVGLAKENSEYFQVVNKRIFKYLDGFKWKSEELASIKYPQYVFNDMLTAITNESIKDTTRFKVNYLVQRSCHIQCYDSIHQGQFHSVASNNSPIIYNNTCTSWRDFSTQLIAAGVRGYIGTLWNIGNKVALNSAKLFYDNVFDSTIAITINKMLRTIDDEDYKDIYLYCGLHFSTIPRVEVKSKTKILNELMASLKRWNSYITRSKEKSLSINAINNIKFICYELAPFYEYEGVTELIAKSIISSSFIEASIIKSEKTGLK